MFYELEYHQRGKDALTNLHHVHTDRLEILQIVSGEGQLLIRDTLYPMTVGCMYLIDATETHCTAPKNLETYTRNKLIISEEGMLRMADALGLVSQMDSLFFKNGGTYCVLGEDEAREADALFKGVCARHAQKNAGDRFLMWTDFFHLLSFAGARGPAEEPGGELIDHILTYINGRIHQKLTLEDIASGVHIDKYYMCHYFKEKTSMTVMEYISDRRINMARRLLMNMNLTIAEIAPKCGYSSASYFSQAFKAIVKKTPAEYRNELFRSGGEAACRKKYAASCAKTDNFRGNSAAVIE